MDKNELLGIWAVSLFLLATVKGDEVCYDRLGCFSDSKPWAGTVERPIGQLPWSPEKINPRFLLYTQQNQNSFQEISAKNASTISSSNFGTSRKTRFIVHGFAGRVEDWLSDMCKRMFQVEDVNCICVDWLGGSSTLYSQAVNNIRVVGAEIAYFVDILSNNFGYSPSNVHIIGHSLGAQAAAEAGKRRPGVGRITGLDPAEPYFQGTPTEVRLDPSDAILVDVIHTDSGPMIPDLGFGTSQLVGHLDFFPNGGVHMPDVTRTLSLPLLILMASGKGSGFPCPSGDCPRMGHYADTFGGVTPSSQTFYLNTGDAKDFSRYRYRVSVTVTGSSSVQGYFNVALYGSKGNTRQYHIFKGTMKAGSTYSAFVDVEVDVGTLTHVKFLWNNNILNPFLPKVGGQTAIVQYGRDGNTSKFCGSETVRENILQTMRAC